MDALQNGFTSVEADVHLHNGMLRVAHDKVTHDAPSLERAYFKPLDSLLNLGGKLPVPFLLMIDIKTEPEKTWREVRRALTAFPRLTCKPGACPVIVFVSGNRPSTAWKENDPFLILDGRPADLGKGISVQLMPVISDRFSAWCDWDGTGIPTPEALQRVRELAARVHKEGKKLRLWAIPDSENAWQSLLDAGVDMINTDRLPELSRFLDKRLQR